VRLFDDTHDRHNDNDNVGVVRDAPVNDDARVDDEDRFSAG
jgi:hypothetical protein